MVKKSKGMAISLISAPFEGDPKDSEKYYTALGKALVMWGRAESQFDKLMDIICSLKEAAPFKPEQLPISMKRRAELMRSLLKNMPALQPIEAPLKNIIPDLLDAAQDRHVIVHGHWNGFNENDTLSSRFIVWRRKKNKTIIERYDVHIDALEGMIKTFDDLNTRMIPITFAAVQLHPTPVIDKPSKPKE